MQNGLPASEHFAILWDMFLGVLYPPLCNIRITHCLGIATQELYIFKYFMPRAKMGADVNYRKALLLTCRNINGLKGSRWTKTIFVGVFRSYYE